MSIYSNMFYNGLPSFGPLPHSPPPHTTGPLSDYETSANYQVSFGISPDDISPVVQQPVTPVAPTIPPVQVMSDTQEPIALRKPYKCPLCSFASARSYNLKTHIATHDKEKSKRFPCSVCKSRFSRKHDLRRHKNTMHERSSSVSSSSSLDSAPVTTDIPEHIMALFEGM
ncbi:hypothetical protein BJV74DRAFT_162227 [Russula compacta]|nr:hypothetical protein BJV74DRAFT_162227 [Russula compacta]